MRISPVTGDLPAVASAAPPPPPVTDAPPAAREAVVAVSETRGTGADSTTDRRRPQTPLPVFDPPLIAQRAVLGLPIGGLVAHLAADQHITHSAAAAIVDREVDSVRRTQGRRTGDGAAEA